MSCFWFGAALPWAIGHVSANSDGCEETVIAGAEIKKGAQRTPSSLFSLSDLADLRAQATKSPTNGQQEKRRGGELAR